MSEPYRLPQLRIDVEGDWFDGDVQITHPGILANLRANLRRDAEGHFVQTRVRIPVVVEDAPWVVTRVEARGETLHAVLNDGTAAVVDPATLVMGPGDVPRCLVKDGAFEARFSRAATFQLLALADYDEATGQDVLRLGGRRVVLRRTAA